MRHVADSLASELIQETAGRGRSQTVTAADLYRPAETFDRSRLTSSDVILHTDRGARRMFLSDLRELGRRSFPDMQLRTQLLSHFAPFGENQGEC